MATKPYFSYQTIRKAIIGLGSILSGIQISKRDAQGNITYSTVPVKYGAKDFHIIRQEEDTTFDTTPAIETIYPVIAYKLVSASYDIERQRNSLVSVQYTNQNLPANNAEKIYLPTPYELEFEAYVITDTEIQSFEIVEQIFPLFSPNYSLPIMIDKDTNLVSDFVYYLSSSTFEDNYQETNETNRTIIWTLGISCKVDFFVGKEQRKQITQATIDMFIDQAMQNNIDNIVIQ